MGHLRDHHSHRTPSAILRSHSIWNHPRPNRRFLRKRITTSVHAPGPIDIVSQDTVPDTLPAPQRPARQRRPPERLIEDEHWN